LSTVKNQIQVLILEDNASDFELMKRELRGMGLDYKVVWAHDRDSFLSALDKFTPDLILLDYSLPGFDGLRALAFTRQRFPNMPAIIVSGAIGEEVAIETLKSGATDYVLKQHLSRLGPVIHRALHEAEQLSERKKMEDELRRHSELLDLAPVLILDMDGRITLWNTGAEEMYGWNAEVTLGSISHDLLKTEFPVPLKEILTELMRSGHWRGELSHTKRDLSRISVSSHWILHRDGQGKPIAILEVNNDITDRKRAEEELRRARDELERRVHERTAELSEAKESLEVINKELQMEISEHERTEMDLIAAKEAAEAAAEAKAAFLANMSHELRTPLNAVIGYSSLLLDDNITSEQRENIESIKNGGEALLAIISDILEFSRAEKEKVSLENQPLSIKHCIEESLGMVSVQALEKGLNLTHTINYDTPDTIIGDPGRIRQILVNLLGNAVKFTDIGDVSVSVSSRVIEGNLRRILFEIKDTGIGMPQDKMNRLFEPFTQMEYVISRKRDGAGLGLAICKKHVELMGGEIWAESEEGKGSVFGFTIEAETIPGKILDFGVKDRIEHYNLSAKKPLSILVAEDNPSNQRVLVEMLKRLGYRPDAVADGCEVLQALQIRPYDLVFMDIRMPEMDGLTATKEIRRLWSDKRPKVVAITAFALEGDRKRCLEAGMDGYIAKPVKVDDLATLLRNI
jgi:PAS domain S-box-containing protein